MLNQPRAVLANSGGTAFDDQAHAETRILQDAVDVQRGGGKILPSDDDARGALVACEWCTDGALREDAFGFSIRHLPSFNKADLQQISRSLLMDADGQTEGALREALDSRYRQWVPGTLVQTLKKEVKPKNMLELHSLEELLQTLKLLELSGKLVLCYYWRESCYACRSVGPKMLQVAAENPEVVYLKINFDEMADYCGAVVQVSKLPFIQAYSGSQGLVDSFAIPITNLPRLRALLAKHANPSSQLACPMMCPYPRPPTWQIILDAVKPIYMMEDEEIKERDTWQAIVDVVKPGYMMEDEEIEERDARLSQRWAKRRESSAGDK